MNWHYAYTPAIWPPFFTTFLLIALSLYSWRRRSVPGALPFTFALLFGALWMSGSSLEAAATYAPAKIFWVKFQAACLLPSATAVTCFLLEYAWPGRWLTRRALALLSIPPLLFVGLILTNDLHHWIWAGFVPGESILPLAAAGNWMLVAYAYGLGIVNILIFGWLFLRSPQHRWPVALMLAGQIAGRVLYALEAVGAIQSGLQIEVIAFWFPIPMYLIALFGFRILDPTALAHRAVVAQMREGMLVVDREGRVAGLNPAAGAILGLPGSRARGRPIQDLLPPHTLSQVGSLGEIEISLGKEPETRHYLLAASLLKDWRGQEAGRLLLLHDVTEQKRAQAQLLEQQRVMAMLHERECLARELHDNLGQAFAFVNAQGQAIRRLLSQGDTATADEYTRRLVEVAREADVDIRESILGLRVALSGQGFFPVLDQYLSRFAQIHGIRAELEKPEGMRDGLLEPLVEVQLLRILQEALTNVRKHAGAGCVRIAFACEEDGVTVTVQDDGQGFDAGAWTGEPGEHVGLRVMRERAEEAGGGLWVESSARAGTRVRVRLPVKNGAVKEADNA